MMKKYIKAMAFSRSNVLDKAKSLANTLNSHVIKCVVYRNVSPEYIDHWVEEIGIYIYSVNKLKSKTALKANDYRNSLFADIGEDRDDAEANLMLFKLHNNEYPDFDITDELITDLYTHYTQLVDAAVPVLASNKVLSIHEWIQVVHSILT